KTLQRQLCTLAKSMPSRLVEKISACLCRSSTITEYEFQHIQAPATDIQKASQLLLTIHRKGPRACQLFFKCLAVCNPSLFETVTGCTTTAAVPPYIINIHNSSLSHCIIGNNNDLKEEDMQRPDQEVTAEDPTETPSIQVKDSTVEFVIIGDNNYMNVGCSLDSDEQEEQESELEDSEG
uniref:Si:dkey-29h14.10 n=1 Tax=Astyanax mexicanus TaxID=7994 RepID=A0A3B1JF16_ASTMX